MKKVHRQVPDVSQRVADEGTEIVERHLAAYGVRRALELPEEGRVHLMRELQAFFQEAIPPPARAAGPRGRGLWGLFRRWWDSLTGDD